MRVFISFKSVDAPFVRSVCDCLRSAGVELWFSEYDVLPRNYRDFDDSIVGTEGVRASLEQAVNQCSHAIIFANDTWAGATPYDSESSDYCGHEAAAILHLLPHERILLVHSPRGRGSEEKFPQLSEVRHYEAHVDAVVCAEEALRFLGAQGVLGIPEWQSSHENVGIYGDRLPLFSGGMYMPRCGFVWDEDKTLVVAKLDTALYFTRFGSPSWPVHLKIEGMNETEGVNATGVGTRILASRSQDRDIYKAYIEYVKSWSDELALQMLGLHLLFLDQTSHFAITYEAKRTIERRYVLNAKGMGEELSEIHLSFYVIKNEFADREAAQKSFFFSAPVIDSMVQNAVFSPPLKYPVCREFAGKSPRQIAQGKALAVQRMRRQQGVAPGGFAGFLWRLFGG